MISQPRPYIRAVIVIAIFTALSTAGGLVKLGTPVGSIAIDSSAGYFVAAFFSPLLGACVGFLGHLASSATGGFPLGWLHLVIGVLQGIWSLIFGAIIRYINRRWAVPLSAVIAILLNGVLAPLLLMLLAPELAGLLKTLIPLLIIASLVNVVVASGAFMVLSKHKSKRL